MTDKLKELYDALIERGLSLLPPKGQLVSDAVTSEAVMIYEALAATPLPKETSYRIRLHSDPNEVLRAISVAFIRKQMGIPDPQATPVLGVKDDHLAVLNPGTIAVSLSDGRRSDVHVMPEDDFGMVVKSVKSRILDWAASGGPGSALGTLSGNALGAVNAGEIAICVTPGGVKGHLAFRVGDSIGNILARVSSLLADVADPRPGASKSEKPRSAAPPSPTICFPRSTSLAWPGRAPEDRWVAGNVLGRSGENTPAVLNRGRITIETTDGHLAYVDVDPRHDFGQVVQCVQLALRLEIERLTSIGKDKLFSGMSAMAKDVCVLRRGKVTIRTSGAAETGFYVEPLDSLSSVEDRVAAKLNALAGVHTPMFGCEAVTGRFVTLRCGKLQIGEPTSFAETVDVVKGASLERVLDQVKEALLKRAGATVGAPKPASSAEQCRFYLYLPHETPATLGAGARFVPDAPLPKGHAEVVTGGTYRLGQGIPCRWVGDGAHHPMVPRWVLQGEAGLCAYPVPPPPRTTEPHAHSFGIVYPRVSNTPGHDTAVVPAGTLLLAGFAGSHSRVHEPSIQTIAHSVIRTGDALLCKTVDGTPWPSAVTIWSFDAPPPGCFVAASAAAPILSEPASDAIPADSLGIVYPKLDSRDGVAVKAGTVLIPNAVRLSGDLRLCDAPRIQTVSGRNLLRGEGILCKTADGSPWPSNVTTWVFDSPPPNCNAYAHALP